jgi:hypothetical protein
MAKGACKHAALVVTTQILLFLRNSTMADLQFKLTDEVWEDMVTLEGAPVTAIVVWDRSLVDEIMAQPITDKTRVFVDIDLYLANQTKLELYGASVTANEGSEPIMGLAEIGDTLARHTRNGAFIGEIAAAEDDLLVLVLNNDGERSLLIGVSAWLEDVWETLPEESI